MQVEDFSPVVLDDETVPLVEDFACTAAPPYSTELVRYLREEALSESNENVSRTWLWLDADHRVGAYHTLSATQVPTSTSGFREGLQTRKPFVPGLMLDQIAVADFVRQEGIHLGFAIFEWTQAQLVLMNRRIAARVIRLDVQLGNWSAYRTYRTFWHLRAMRQMILRSRPLQNRDGTPVTVPDPSLPACPPDLDPDTYVKLWYDVYAPPGWASTEVGSSGRSVQ